MPRRMCPFPALQRESRRPIRPSHSMGHLRATASSRAKNKTLDGSDDVACVRNDPSHVAYNAQMEIWEIQRELRRGEMVQVGFNRWIEIILLGVPAIAS